MQHFKVPISPPRLPSKTSLQDLGGFENLRGLWFLGSKQFANTNFSAIAGLGFETQLGEAFPTPGIIFSDADNVIPEAVWISWTHDFSQVWMSCRTLLYGRLVQLDRSDRP